MLLVYLDRLPESVTEIFFALSAYHCGDLSLFAAPQFRIFDAEWPECRISDYQVADAGRAEAVIVCCLYRHEGFWKVNSFGKTCSGTAWDFRPMIALLSSVQLEKYPKPFVPPEPEPPPYRPPHLFPPEPSSEQPRSQEHGAHVDVQDHHVSRLESEASVDASRHIKDPRKLDPDFDGVHPGESSSYLSAELESQRPSLVEQPEADEAKKSGACVLM